MMELISTLIGGLGLFLMGMHLMTSGLKAAAGPALKNTLKAGTRSRLRGLASGTLITALVQSSSAVTVATIGFVNAGLLNLAQSVTVIYGCNIGTTMTSWLVALVGFKIKIDAFALPLVGLGMVANLAGHNPRIKQLGVALAGFGIFFIGLDFLKNAFTGLEQSLPLATLGSSPLGLFLMVLAGFVLTFLMQSSSAAMAVTLSLAASGAIPLSASGALVIGANVGTTSTAMLAVIGATPNAKRIAAVHVIFNLVTALAGIILLLLGSDLITRSLQPDPAELVTLLALFHTLFNLLGVLLMWPITQTLVTFLKQRFRTQEEDEGRPRYLDKNIVGTPTLALEAMCRELGRINHISTQMGRTALSTRRLDKSRLQAQLNSVQRLISKLGKYNQLLAQQDLSANSSQMLPLALRVGRYANEIARLATRMPDYYDSLDGVRDRALRQEVNTFIGHTLELLESCAVPVGEVVPIKPAREPIKDLEHRYQALKEQILSGTVRVRLKPKESIALLDALSHIHRLAQQAEKGARYWNSLVGSVHPPADTEAAEATDGAPAPADPPEETPAEDAVALRQPAGSGVPGND